MNNILEQCGDLLIKVREKQPLIHHITNYVTMNDCANVVLAIGGSPIMAMDKNEVEEIVSCSSALVINMGTLNENNVHSMVIAGKKANEIGIPVILDPVGVGATNFRRQTVRKLLDSVQFAIIKGNMSEIKTLAGVNVTSKGVDSNTDDIGKELIARNLANELNTTIVITGKDDIVSRGKEVVVIHNGPELLTKVTGTGCMTTSLIGAFASVADDFTIGGIAGVMLMGIAGELAYKMLLKDENVGSFRVKLMDCIAEFNEQTYIDNGNYVIAEK
ncbi:hydroxyethylthiazole kinase [Natranaerovirga pectinivora]|uniref:Hydroxyethylthiazole kinase n=1 Tax=Natranaerovirga pectinivora TaxID=682400 RepID=A0A4R3MPQ3_9FIRM|nr:hydroxyethylthiazole kinase [Natranaerovirga pectinivora]TCT16261.1 hydroxyethylthiazole kinase [Natranaerovirga pectinivora]